MQALSGLSGLSGIVTIASNQVVAFGYLIATGVAAPTATYAVASGGGPSCGGSALVGVTLATLIASGGATVAGQASATSFAGYVPALRFNDARNSMYL